MSRPGRKSDSGAFRDRSATRCGSARMNTSGATKRRPAPPLPARMSHRGLAQAAAPAFGHGRPTTAAIKSGSTRRRLHQNRARHHHRQLKCIQPDEQNADHRTALAGGGQASWCTQRSNRQSPHTPTSAPPTTKKSHVLHASSRKRPENSGGHAMFNTNANPLARSYYSLPYQRACSLSSPMKPLDPGCMPYAQARCGCGPRQQIFIGKYSGLKLPPAPRRIYHFQRGRIRQIRPSIHPLAPTHLSVTQYTHFTRPPALQARPVRWLPPQSWNSFSSALLGGIIFAAIGIRPRRSLSSRSLWPVHRLLGRLGSAPSMATTSASPPAGSPPARLGRFSITRLVICTPTMPANGRSGGGMKIDLAISAVPR